jgi:hypothetical protein
MYHTLGTVLGAGDLAMGTIEGWSDGLGMSRLHVQDLLWKGDVESVLGY